MLKDFTVQGGVGIQVAGAYFDLHNDFDLYQVVIDFEARSLTIVLVRTRHGGAASAGGNRLTLRFMEPDFVQLSGGALTAANRDVAELGYKNPGDFDHDWLIREDHVSPADHFFVRLSNDEFVRVHSRLATANVES